MIHQRFFIIIAAILFLWMLPYFCFLRPWNKDIKKNHAKIQVLKDNIVSLLQGEESLQQETSDEKEEQNKKLTNRIQEIIQKIEWQQSVNKSNSVLEFRSQYDQKKAKLQQEANRIGIPVEETLGFPRSLPATIEENYWISLELGSYIISQLLQMGNKEDILQSIQKIHYPKLQETSGGNRAFFLEYPVELTMLSSYSFILKIIHFFSEPAFLKNSNRPFPILVIREISLLHSSKPDIIEAKICFAACKIVPDGEISPGTEKQQKPITPQTIPIWERY